MRPITLAALFMLPVAALAQAGSAGSKFSTVAELAVPAAPTVAAVSSALALTPSPSMAAVAESIHTRTIDDFGATKAFNPIPTAPATAPNLKSASAFGLLPQDLAKQPAVIKVVLDAVVDANGVPHNISVSRSGGAVIDQKAIAAVSQYRFQPASVGNRATESAVSIVIKIKQ